MELPTRSYFCTVCTVSQVSRGFPKDWYVLNRSRGAELPKVKLGIYCSLDCLVENLPRLRIRAEAFAGAN